MTDALRFSKDFTVAKIINDGNWFIPQHLFDPYANIYEIINSIQIADQDDNKMIWCGQLNDEFSVKSAYEYYREKAVKVMWRKKLWTRFIPPKFSVLCKRITQGRMSTAANLHRRNVLPAPVCVNCIIGAVEDENHLFLHGTVAREIWRWLPQVLEVNFVNFSSTTDPLKWS